MEIPGRPLSADDTAPFETPARSAMSAIVTRWSRFVFWFTGRPPVRHLGMRATLEQRAGRPSWSVPVTREEGETGKWAPECTMASWLAEHDEFDVLLEVAEKV